MSSRSFERTKKHKEDGIRQRRLLMPCFYFVEFPLFVAVSVATYTLHFTSTFEHAPAYYSSSDFTILQSFTPANERSVSSISAHAGAILGPVLIIILVEIVLFGTMLCTHDDTKFSIRSAGCTFPSVLRRFVRYIGLYIFGFMISTILCDLIQLMIPVPPPYFATICQTINQTEDVNSVSTCVLTEKELKPESLLKQFPSFFVTISSYASTFCLIYLRNAMPDAGPAVKTLVTWSPLSFAYVLGILEVAENVSHPSSVLAGWILGMLVAIYMNFGLYTSEEGKLSKACQRNVKYKHSSPFDTGLGAGFMVEEDTDDVVEVQPPHATRMAEECTSFHSPAFSRLSHVSEGNELSQNTASPAHSSSLTNVERNVIKELQTYIAETDFKSSDTGSPRPADIRQLAKSGKSGGDQRLSTFCSQSSPDSSPNHSTSPPDNTTQLHSTGCSSIPAKENDHTQVYTRRIVQNEVDEDNVHSPLGPLHRISEHASEEELYLVGHSADYSDTSDEDKSENKNDPNIVFEYVNSNLK